MHKYQNTKTGAIVNSPCILKGGDWVKIEAKPKKSTPKKKVEK